MQLDSIMSQVLKLFQFDFPMYSPLQFNVVINTLTFVIGKSTMLSFCMSIILL